MQEVVIQDLHRQRYANKYMLIQKTLKLTSSYYTAQFMKLLLNSVEERAFKASYRLVLTEAPKAETAQADLPQSPRQPSRLPTAQHSQALGQILSLSGPISLPQRESTGRYQARLLRAVKAYWCPQPLAAHHCREMSWGRGTQWLLRRIPPEVSNKSQVRGPSSPTRGAGLLTSNFSLGVQEAGERSRAAPGAAPGGADS